MAIVVATPWDNVACEIKSLEWNNNNNISQCANAINQKHKVDLLTWGLEVRW